MPLFASYQLLLAGMIITISTDNILRLTHIKLAGFKSFVEPTHIPVPGKLVGVVGPNG